LYKATPNVLQTFSVKDQGRSVKRRLIAELLLSFRKSWVARFNGDVKILIGSWKIAAMGMRSTKLARNSPERLARRRRPQVAMHSQLPPFLVLLFIYLTLWKTHVEQTTIIWTKWN